MSQIKIDTPCPAHIIISPAIFWTWIIFICEGYNNDEKWQMDSGSCAVIQKI